MSNASVAASRQAWIDNLRTFVIVLVVNMHCCVTYSYVGDWYLNDGPEGSLADKLPYILWIFQLQSFFMGLLFFLAGSLAEQAIRRHGPGSFLRERAVRLGLPALLYMALIQPLIIHGLLGIRPLSGDTSFLSAWLRYFTTGQVFSGSGPTWFLLALLAFSAIFAILRRAFFDHTAGRTSKAPSSKVLLAFALGLSIATAVTRGVFPIGTSVFNFQLGYFPQYIAAFAAGVAAGRGAWLDELAMSRRARLAGWACLIGGPVAFGLLIRLGGSPTEGPAPGEHGPILYFGGWHAQAYGAAVWEQWTGTGLALGAMAWFRRRFNRAGGLSRWMAARSFGVYVLHAPVLIALTLAFAPIQIGRLPHVVLLTASVLLVSFAAADLARRLPGLKKIL